MGDPQAPRTGGLLELTRPVTTLPPARTIGRLLTSEWDCRSTEPLRVEAVRDLLDRSMTMMAAKTTDDLTPWLGDAVDIELASLYFGVPDDDAAVRAAIVEPWSDGRTGGQVTELEIVERQMYGRAEIDLLRARTGQPR